MKITDPIQPHPEACSGAGRYVPVPQQFLPPPDKASEGRVNDYLRRVAAMRDPQLILTTATLGTSLGDTPDMVQAAAQLAVTGRAAFTKFKQWHPGVSDLISVISAVAKVPVPAVGNPWAKALAGLSANALEVNAVRALNTAYETARLLTANDANSYNAWLKAPWIAVSGEDDPPHRPVNVNRSPFPQVRHPLLRRRPSARLAIHDCFAADTFWRPKTEHWACGHGRGI